MKTTVAKIRKNINENRTFYAFCAGSIVTSVTFAALEAKWGNLALTKEQLELLKKGGALVYTVKGQTLHLMNIPAVEATLPA